MIKSIARINGSKRKYVEAKGILMAALLLLGLLTGCAQSGSSVDTPRSTPTGQASLPVVVITAVDYGYQMPDTIDVRGGLVDIALVNNGTEAHQAQVARLDRGVTREQVLDELVTKKDQAAAFAQLTFAGGPDTVAPGYGQETVVRLTAGQYVLLCFVVGSDGIPHFDKGMIHFFNVNDSSVQAATPRDDGELVMRDNGYVLSDVIGQARALTLRVVNQGVQAHELNIVKLAAGKRMQDIIAYFQAPSGPPPFVEEGGMAALAAGETGWLKMDLDAGTYAAFSFLPDVKTGRPQLTLGMIAQFSVQS